MTREEFIVSKEYLVSQFQLGLLNLIGNYKDNKKLKDIDLAKELGVSKGYVSQLLNATVDHKISKVVDLALACDKVPLLFFVDKKNYIENDRSDKEFTLSPCVRLQNITFEPDFNIDYQLDKTVGTTSNGHALSNAHSSFCKT